jgi:HSP20 family protein
MREAVRTCNKGNVFYEEDHSMAEPAIKLSSTPAQKEPTQTSSAWHPLQGLQSLRREVDRLFEDFDGGFLRSTFRRSTFDVAPFWRPEISWGHVPAVDIADKQAAYEITAELPGLEPGNVEVKFSNGALHIRGEKKSEKEEKKKDVYLSERRYGVFERSFQLPEGVDTDRISANFKNGVLTVTVPKTPEAQKTSKTIEVKGS